MAILNFFFFNSAHHPPRTMRLLDKGSLYSCSEADPCWTQAAPSPRSVYKPAAACRVAVPKPGRRPRAPSLPPFLPSTGLSEGLGATSGPLRRGHPGSCAASLPLSPLGVGHPRRNSRSVFPLLPPNHISPRPSPLFPRPGVGTPAGPVLAHWRPSDQELSVIRPQNMGASGRKRGEAARCHGDPGRPRVRGCPRPGPGSGPCSDPEASVSAIASPPLPAAAFGQDAGPRVRCRPVPLTHGGGAVSGGESLGPASSSLRARGSRHGVCDQARCGPQRSPRREDARAVPRRRDGGGGQEPAARGGETGLAELPGVQTDRKKEKEREGGLGCEEPEGGTLVGPPACRPPGFTAALRLHFQEDASHKRTFPSAGPAGLTNTPDRSPFLFTNS